MDGMADRHQARLGAVQETLFIPLAGRARASRGRRPVLRDPKAVEMMASIDYDAAKYGRGAGGTVTVLRTAIFDFWVRAFLDEHPAGTVVEIGTGLNTRFERVDNGAVHWIDLDLPDTIELRRAFFADTDRRRMVAASVLDEAWLPIVAVAATFAAPIARRRTTAELTGGRRRPRTRPETNLIRHLRPGEAGRSDHVTGSTSSDTSPGRAKSRGAARDFRMTRPD